MDFILSRRSIRKYTTESIEEEKITSLLRAAMSAPSAHNQQPWLFVVIDDRDILNKIPDFHPYSSMLLEAPLAILVCADTSGLPSPEFWPQDCAAATENILIAANSCGIGSVWLGVYPHEDLMDGLSLLLDLPGNVQPFALVSLGYAAVEKSPSERFDTARIHRNHW